VAEAPTTRFGISVHELREAARRIGDDWINTPYYDQAEQGEWLAPFWSDGSPFLRLFCQLDLTCVVELACGHGRHSEKLRDRAQTAILMDINPRNVKFCEERFSSVPQFRCALTDGYKFDSIEDEECTAVFCYDAMVHFDSDVVRSYLVDAARILKPGGRGLFHHSNHTANPGGNLHEDRNWRNFMSESLFHHYALKAGLRRVTFELLNWGGRAALDCLTLVEKPVA
jgi:SAM-dependent methyltransferase